MIRRAFSRRYESLNEMGRRRRPARITQQQLTLFFCCRIHLTDSSLTFQIKRPDDALLPPPPWRLGQDTFSSVSVRLPSSSPSVPCPRLIVWALGVRRSCLGQIMKKKSFGAGPHLICAQQTSPRQQIETKPAQQSLSVSIVSSCPSLLLNLAAYFTAAAGASANKNKSAV